jgi:prepilin-type N-terminal cleavage/methylation domain-containing protein
MAASSQRGFTLFELLVTMTVAVALFAVALPSFNELISDRRLRLVAESLAESLQLVRSEAINSGYPASLLLAASGEVGSQWVGAEVVRCSAQRCLQWRAAADITVSRQDLASGQVEFDRDGRPLDDSGAAVCLAVGYPDIERVSYSVALRPSGSPQLLRLPSGQLACQ